MIDFIIDILKLIPFSIIPYMWGYDDGRMKKDGTEAHWPKWIILACLFYCIGMNYDYMVLIGFSVMWKPLFDYGWSKGMKLPLYLGNTSWTDRLVKRIFGKFVPMLYMFLIFIGIVLMKHFS